MADAAFKISVTVLQKLLDLSIKAFSGVVRRAAVHFVCHWLTVLISVSVGLKDDNQTYP